LFGAEETEAPLPQGLWRGRSFFDVARVAAEAEAIARAAPFRRMKVPGGGEMSVAMTNCGLAGWVADERGYRYSPLDPLSGQPWPGMPLAWRVLAARAAEEAGFPAFDPDVCLINRYTPGARMGLHRDSDEADLRQPIVSLSLGASAVFLWGGLRRRDPVLGGEFARADLAIDARDQHPLREARVEHFQPVIDPPFRSGQHHHRIGLHRAGRLRQEHREHQEAQRP
jgi:alkylated DNA repair protein (DNA oxidative demethylase)